MNFDTFSNDDHDTPEYRLGLAQLEEWHARCRAKRLGIKHMEKGKSRLVGQIRQKRARVALEVSE